MLLLFRHAAFGEIGLKRGVLFSHEKRPLKSGKSRGRALRKYKEAVDLSLRTLRQIVNRHGAAGPWAKRANKTRRAVGQAGGRSGKKRPKSARGRGRGEICRVSEGFVCRGRFFAKERIWGKKRGKFFKK